MCEQTRRVRILDVLDERDLLHLVLIRKTSGF